MTAEYLVILADEAEAGQLERVKHRTPDLAVVHESRRTLVVASGCGTLGLADQGVVLGDVFDRATGAVLAALSPDTVAKIVATRGQWLIEEAWGGYVAVVASPTSSDVVILRDPSGALPAYLARVGRSWWIFSNLAIGLRAGLPPVQLDWTSVGQMLVYPQFRGERTGLRGVEELLPACRIAFSSSGERQQDLAWSPWTFAAEKAAFTRHEQAAQSVRAAVTQSVASWARHSGKVVLELSGGLDSSIIACALPADADATLFNLHTPSAEGDERAYASVVAATVGRPLATDSPDPRPVEIRRPRPGPHPRPAAQLLLQPIESTFRRLGVAVGVDTYFSGLGGDNVFCALTTAAPAADALLSLGPGRPFFAVLGDLSRRHEATLWHALRATLRKALAPNSHLGLKPVVDFLTPDVMLDAPRHPWLALSAGMLPGRQEHVAGIVVALSFLDRYEHADLAPVRFPLLAQPVLEACLRTPTWMWNAGGRNRAVARDAFRDLLPPEIFHRQTKGGLNAFMGAIFEANRAELSDHLVRGWLATAGLIEGQAIAKALSNPKLSSTHMNRILQFADVESWARTWPIKAGPQQAP